MSLLVQHVLGNLFSSFLVELSLSVWRLLATGHFDLVSLLLDDSVEVQRIFPEHESHNDLWIIKWGKLTLKKKDK